MDSLHPNANNPLQNSGGMIVSGSSGGSGKSEGSSFYRNLHPLLTSSEIKKINNKLDDNQIQEINDFPQ